MPFPGCLLLTTADDTVLGAIGVPGSTGEDDRAVAEAVASALFAREAVPFVPPRCYTYGNDPTESTGGDRWTSCERGGAP